MTEGGIDLPGKPEDTLSGRFLAFILDKEVYGIEIRYVTEIIGIQPIYKPPEVFGYIKGIINLRGRIIPVIDMRLKFRMEAKAYTARTCIVVVEAQSISAGLIVDQVAEVLTIKEIAPPPKLQSIRMCRTVSGIGKVDGEIKLLLDCEALLSDEDRETLNEIKRGEMKC